MTNKKRFFRVFLIAAAAAGMLILVQAFIPRSAWAWGSATSAPIPGDFATHQFLYRQAFNCLRGLPGFSRGKFPELSDFLAHEGVEVSYGGNVTGPGPDAEGATQYSWHWYNPITGEGGAPAQVYELMKQLARNMIDAQASDPALQAAALQSAAHAAAWGSHYFSDMYCPYHVVGVNEARARSWAGMSPLTLAEVVTGVPPGQDWSASLARFIAASDAATAARSGPLASGHVDWYDPWYWDSMITTGNSTHAGWEERNPQHASRFSCDSGFDPNWVNGVSAFDTFADVFGRQAEKFTIAVAQNTRSHMNAWIANPEPAVDSAVQGLFTLWRASFSMLEPAIEVSTQADPAAGGKMIVVKGRVRNPLHEDAANGQMRLTVARGRIMDGDETQSIGTVYRQSDKTDLEALWQVEPDASASPTDPCLLKLEVIASLKLPDLQYAVCTRELKHVENSIVLLIDSSGSMGGKKIENAKASAQKAVDAMDEKTEVAIIAFRDCPGTITVISPFTLVTPATKTEIKDKIAAIGAGGMTPLAKAVAYAGHYLHSQGSGKQLNLIVLSDGEETCDKPDAPANAVRDMNP